MDVDSSSRRDAWRQPSKGETRRTELLRALERLLALRPLADINVGDIAAAAGLRRTAFYFYFPSKARAVEALLGDAFDEIVAGAPQFMEGATDPSEAIRQALLELWSYWGRHAAALRAMQDARDDDAEVRISWDKWVERFVEAIAAVVERGGADLRWASGGPDLRAVVRLLVTMNAAALEQWSRNPRPEAVHGIVEASAHVWTRSLYGPDTPRRPGA